MLNLQFQNIRQNHGSRMSIVSEDIINLPASACKDILIALSGVEARRLIAVLWDHGSLSSSTHDWPISFSLDAGECKIWMANRTEEECWSIMCELQEDGLLEGDKSGIEGAVPTYANISQACALSAKNPKHGPAQASWNRTRTNLALELERLNRSINGAPKIAKIPKSDTTTTRKTSRHKASAKVAARKSAANKTNSGTAYDGAQLPLPAEYSLGLAQPTTYEMSFYPIKLPDSSWIQYRMMLLDAEYPGSQLHAVGRRDKEGTWIKCCDCGTFHATNEFDQGINVINHLHSYDHRLLVDMNQTLLQGDNAGWGAEVFGDW